MVRTKSGNSYWEDVNKVMETVIIDKKIKEEFSIFAKERGLNKSKLIETFYREILMKMQGNLNTSQGYITINIFTPFIQKKK
jgi:hypothetical protein